MCGLTTCAWCVLATPPAPHHLVVPSSARRCADPASGWPPPALGLVCVQPQADNKGERKPEERTEFAHMLRHSNLLYLAASVLVLADLSYLSRFWTLFECWLALVRPSSRGLTATTRLDSKMSRERQLLKQRSSALRAPNVTPIRRHWYELIDRALDEHRGRPRYAIRCIHNAPEAFQPLLESFWAGTNWQTAWRVLASPDIVVTNASDKQSQLLKVPTLNRSVQRIMSLVRIQRWWRRAMLACCRDILTGPIAHEQRTPPSEPRWLPGPEPEPPLEPHAEEGGGRQAVPGTIRSPKVGRLKIAPGPARTAPRLPSPHLC